MDLIPVFKCDECDTEFYVDIYTQSTKGILKTFIDSTCCPICSSFELRVCFVKRLNQKPKLEVDQNFVPESLLNYYEQLKKITE